MLKQTRLLIGISIFWLALSMLFDGINTLVLPLQISAIDNQTSQASLLGLLTFFGLIGSALIQPVAGALSDRLQPSLGRKGFIGIGLLLSLVSLVFFATFKNLAAILIGYLAIQLSASIAQAGQQGLLPDLVDERRRGMASGVKGFMDIGGAMLGFLLLGQLLGSSQTGLAVLAIAITLVIAYLVAVVLTPEDKPGRSNVTRSGIPLSHAFRLDLINDAAFVRLLISRFLFLLGIYATGRFLLFFVADRLGLETPEAAEQAGALLAGLALITILASPVTGWMADRLGRLPLMVAGSILGALSALMLVWAANPGQILLFGGLMSLGSAGFTGGSWALIADLVPKNESARYFGLANFSTAGSAACAGLFGPVIDGVERISPGDGYNILFILAAMAFITSVLPLKNTVMKEVRDVRERNKNQGKVRTDASGLAVLSVSTDPASSKEDTYSS